MEQHSSLLGGVLVQRHSLSISELAGALEQQRRTGSELADVLVEMGHDKGIVETAQAELSVLPAADQPLRVLVVDDEPIILMMLDGLLSDTGYEVETADCVAEGRRLWSEKPFDLALLDKNLPDGTGLDLLREFKRSNRFVEVAIVTGYANLESTVEAIQLDVSDYFTKPFNNTEVLARIQRMAAVFTLRRRYQHLRLQQRDQKSGAIDSISRALSLLGQDDVSGCRTVLAAALSKLTTPQCK